MGKTLKSIVLILLAVAVVAIPIFSQAPTGDRPQFEVASIKVHPPPLTQIGISARGGRFVATGFSVKMLVGRGYAVPESRIIGGPNWIDSERYDIEAKAAENAAPSAGVMAMWPALTVVANTAPKEIKAPAKTLSARVVIRSLDAFWTPVFSARMAMSPGMIASNVIT